MIIFSTLMPRMIKEYLPSLELDYVYNLCAPVDDVPYINLIPNFNVPNGIESYEFDLAYMNYVFCNDVIFLELMNKIILPLYDNKNVIILVSNSSIYSSVGESLIKLLQQRYNLIPDIVNTVEDLYDLKDHEAFDDTESTLNMQNDKNRWLMMMINKPML